jgi:hypothetical protein
MDDKGLLIYEEGRKNTTIQFEQKVYDVMDKKNLWKMFWYAEFTKGKWAFVKVAPWKEW